MRKVDAGEKEKWPLTSLPVSRPNADRLERRTLVPIKFSVSPPYGIESSVVSFFGAGGGGLESHFIVLLGPKPS